MDSPLARYGDHDIDCRKRGGADRYRGQHPCSCGLDAAIESEAETRAILVDVTRAKSFDKFPHALKDRIVKKVLHG